MLESKDPIIKGSLQEINAVRDSVEAAIDMSKEHSPETWEVQGKALAARFSSWTSLTTSGGKNQYVAPK